MNYSAIKDYIAAFLHLVFHFYFLSRELTMKKLRVLCAGALLGFASTTWADIRADFYQQIPIIVGFFNEGMSIPKGWELKFSGYQDGVFVFDMHRDFDRYPQTQWLQVNDQMQRLMCQEGLEHYIDQGIKVRTDAVDTEKGKTQRTKGSLLNCD
jgi:hypothetical protein